MNARIFFFVGSFITMQCMAQHTNVMTFDNFEHSGLYVLYLEPPILANEMVISSVLPWDYTMAYPFGVEATDDQFYRGSAGLYNGAASGITILSRSNGAPFDFIGIDLAAITPPDQGNTVTFYGYRGFDLVATDTLTFPPGHYGGTFTAFTLSKLTNVTEVQWPQTNPTAHQFDNVRVVLSTAEAARPVIRLEYRTNAVTLNICGLIVNTPYVLEYSTNLVDWYRERSFSSFSTVNTPGFVSPASAVTRFYRVRGS